VQTAEEYCWAITQTAGKSCCCQSGYSVLGSGFLLGFLAVHVDYIWLIICVLSHYFSKLLRAPNLPESNYYISLHVP